MSGHKEQIDVSARFDSSTDIEQKFVLLQLANGCSVKFGEQFKFFVEGMTAITPYNTTTSLDFPK